MPEGFISLFHRSYKITGRGSYGQASCRTRGIFDPFQSSPYILVCPKIHFYLLCHIWILDSDRRSVVRMRPPPVVLYSPNAGCGAFKPSSTRIIMSSSIWQNVRGLLGEAKGICPSRGYGTHIPRPCLEPKPSS